MAGCAKKAGNGFVSLGDALGVTQGLGDPPAEHACPHRGGRPVQHIDQGHAFRMGWRKQLEVADGKPVHGHILPPFHPAQRGHVAQAVMLGGAHIVQGRTCSDHRKRLSFEAEPLQALGAEMAFERFLGEIQLPYPVVQGETVACQGQ